MTIRALIVDDEPHAREGIRIRLKDFPAIDILGECSSGTEAVEFVTTHRPELVFLDIQMPEMNGFEVLQKITIAPPPLVIFVTAFDTYAIKAFEFHALDYLLKPIRDDRFREAMNRVQGELHRRTIEQYANALQVAAREYLDGIGGAEDFAFSGPGERYLDQIMVKTKEGITVLHTQQIDWLESAGDYVYIHTNAQKHLIRETLASFEERLNPQKFVRIHRSCMINTNQIRLLRPTEHGDFDVFLFNGTKLKMSRTYRAHFEKTTGNVL